MKYDQKKSCSRREFLRLAALVSAGVLIDTTVLTPFQKKVESDMLIEKWNLNPAFLLKEVSTNEVELFTYLHNGKKLKYVFSGLEADLLRNISEEVKFKTVIPAFAVKFNLTNKQCENKVIKSLREFHKAQLIYSGEKMIVKKSEIIYD